MMIKSASIELKRKNSNAICVGLHPGTVDSKLSQPFHKHIKQSMIITPEDSVSQLIQTLSSITLQDTGLQFAYDGEQIPLMNVVWFKRDLRLIDHEPLNLAIKKMTLFYVCILLNLNYGHSLI